MTHTDFSFAPPPLTDYSEVRGIQFHSTTDAGPVWSLEDRDALATLAEQLSPKVAQLRWHLFGPDPEQPQRAAALLVLPLFVHRGRTIGGVVKSPGEATLLLGDFQTSVLVAEDVAQLVNSFVQALLAQEAVH